MIISSPNITIVNGATYNIPSPIFPQTGQPWAVEISNFSPENLMVISSMGQKLINPYTVDLVGDPFGEMPPVPIAFTTSDPASGAPASTVPYYVSIRWCTWPDGFTQSYPGILQPAVVSTTGFVATNIIRTQSTFNIPNASGQSSVAKLFPNTVNAKSLLVAGITWDLIGGFNISGVADNINGAWTLLGNYTSPTRKVALYALANSVSGNITVTVTFGGGVYNQGLVIAEYGNLPTILVGLGSANGEQSTASPTTTAMVTTNNGLLLGLAVTTAGASETQAPGANWSSVVNSPGTASVVGMMLCDQGIPNNVGPGSYAFSWTASNNGFSNTSLISGVKSS